MKGRRWKLNLWTSFMSYRYLGPPGDPQSSTICYGFTSNSARRARRSGILEIKSYNKVLTLRAVVTNDKIIRDAVLEPGIDSILLTPFPSVGWLVS